MDLRARLLILVVAFFAQASAAQLLSPGKLASPHSGLEGLGNCTKCHEPGNRLASARCLSCHTAIGKRAAARKGLHGLADVRVKQCASCHREHRGTGHELISWGKGGQSRFNHARTGWPLVGGHKAPKCADCHERRRIKAADARKLQLRRRDTFLGLSTTCQSCHFDEHRGQTRSDKRGCQHCHDTTEFKKAPRFRHNRDARFKLTGKHRRVRCTRCHTEEVTEHSEATFPKPVSQTFRAFTGLEFKRCTECHRDPHKSERGNRCERCHSTKGWQALNASAKDFGFHEKTKFPLRGAHVEVACKSCHGPFKGERQPNYKNMAFEKCSDCHMDAHVGQLSGERDCSACHGVDRFSPSSFYIDDHQSARFPLEGAHRAVACRACHIDNKRLRRQVSREVTRDLARKGRPVVVSTAALKLDKVTGQCSECHEDVHEKQFEHRREGCRACHQTQSFRALTFDHQVDARFALEGKHQDLSCAACHRPAKVVRYRPLAQKCSACHADPHVGQFQEASCADCHAATGFEPTIFRHSKSRFPLEGEHRLVSCAKCHPSVPLDDGVSAAWYRGVPLECGGCHADQHGGRFQEYTP